MWVSFHLSEFEKCNTPLFDEKPWIRHLLHFFNVNLDFAKSLQTTPVERYAVHPATLSKSKHAPVLFYKWNVFHNNTNELDITDSLY